MQWPNRLKAPLWDVKQLPKRTDVREALDGNVLTVEARANALKDELAAMQLVDAIVGLFSTIEKRHGAMHRSRGHVQGEAA
jgi:hypothetical protein